MLPKRNNARTIIVRKVQIIKKFFMDDFPVRFRVAALQFSEAFTKSDPQCLHLIASPLISSAQYGHFLFPIPVCSLLPLFPAFTKSNPHFQHIARDGLFFSLHFGQIFELIAIFSLFRKKFL